MLCVEGIARALNVFKHNMQPPKFKLADMTGVQCIPLHLYGQAGSP